ncbi:velvet factor-domain-containing protein [Tricladium varicosporioides]|nr:velvet factor-domain-containing protein [Hymenoscyphus varicosporioides]
MPISGLLSDGPSFAPHSASNGSTHPFSPVPTRTPPKYSIQMRQQPLAARACGFGERDRRVIDPPPILQMRVEDPHATPEDISAMLRQPCAVVHCTLWDPVANKDDTAMPGTTDKRQQRRLMGTLVSSPFYGTDEHDVEGCFFTFPDLSVRTPGTYSLRFSLMIIDPMQMRPGNSIPVSSVVFSDPFHVYNAKDFSGMRASTELTKKLKHQGCLISVKKGNAKPGGSNSRDDDDEDDDEDLDDGGEDTKKKKPAKRAKR